jgi:twitching motility protein PilT
MALDKVNFSDLIIFPDGSASFKGCPDHGQQLIPIPHDCKKEVEELPIQLSDKILSLRNIDPTTGLKTEPWTFRFLYKGITFRVASINDIGSKKQTWFLRRLPSVVPSLNELGLPSFLCKWLLQPEQKQGLILVAGAQASGKTTTASSLVADRLRLYGGHALTFENPAELPLNGTHGENGGHCFQIEINGEHELPIHIEKSHLFASPNIIYIGEIHTKFAALEALRVALGSRQQLVISTIHGFDIIAALERLINWAKELDGSNACENLANCLLAIILQDLEAEPRMQKIPQFLLLPFPFPNQTKESIMRVKGIRSKLRNNQLISLQDDMNDIRALIKENGINAI